MACRQLIEEAELWAILFILGEEITCWEHQRKQVNLTVLRTKKRLRFYCPARDHHVRETGPVDAVDAAATGVPSQMIVELIEDQEEAEPNWHFCVVVLAMRGGQELSWVENPG